MTFGSKYFLNSLAWESVSNTIETAPSGSLRHLSMTGPRPDVRTVAGPPNLPPDGVTSLGTTFRSTKPPRKSKRGLDLQVFIKSELVMSRWSCKLDSRLSVVLERMSLCVVVDESVYIINDPSQCRIICVSLVR